MAKNALPVFHRDLQSGSMTEIAFDELAGSLPVHDHAARVLVVDDDETDRHLTIWNLGKAWPAGGKLTAECAADGAEALELMRRHRYTLVVLDWKMPGKDGLTVLQTMRGNGWNIPVVVVSGEHRESVACHLQSMSATYVNKNELNPSRLRNAITASIQLQEPEYQIAVGLST
jgi:CheY-like chemotaxis protein